MLRRRRSTLCSLFKYDRGEQFDKESIDDPHDDRADKDEPFFSRYIEALESHGQTEYGTDYDTV